MLLPTLISQEQALVLPGERRPQLILEQTGTANDQRLVAKRVQHCRETVHDLRRERAVLEGLDNARVLEPYRVDGLVLLLCNVGQSVEADERRHHIRSDIPSFRYPYRESLIGQLGRLLNDARGQEQARRLAS